MKQRKTYGDYYLGLDIGTSSVGWAVTDLNYNVLKFHGKGMWGIRLFDEAKTAEERRRFRSARRRNERETQRIRLLQELFAEEIAKKDFGFFMRLRDSKLYEEDKEDRQPNSLFNDPDYKDKDYAEQYPTIYHLRKELMQSKEPHDVRLVYLAIHHILKHRGHFLFSGEFQDVSDLKVEPLVESLLTSIEEQCGYTVTCKDTSELASVLSDASTTVTRRKSALSALFECEKEYSKKLKEIVALLSGGKTALNKVFGDESYKESDNNSISFKGSQYEEGEEAYRALLLDRFDVVEAAKALYDWGVLQNVLSGEESISASKVKVYDQHKADLKLLKKAVKEYCPDKYDLVFREQTDKSPNYSAYIGNYRNGGKHNVIEKKCAQEEFCDFLKKKIFKGITIDDSRYCGMEERIMNGTFMPKQRVKDNSVIPYQVHKKELEMILSNAESYLPFLTETDERGLSVSDKIKSIMTYRIPYYVGPINGAHQKDDNKGFYWAVRKSNEAVRPWNFEEVIDLEESAERFIRRMTNKCTYLIGEDVLPKDSLLYSKFMVLNELNNLRIDEETIPVELKQRIYHELFMNNKKVSGRKLRDYLISNGIIDRNSNARITGFDRYFKSSLTSYRDFRAILQKDTFTDAEQLMIENIIKYVVLFGEDRKMLARKIRRDYAEVLTEEQIRRITKLKYSGWGRLSERFLTAIKEVDPKTGELGEDNIITALYQWSGNPNLMELLSNDHGFSIGIEAWNAGGVQKKDTVMYQDLDDLYVSVPVKRSIWQTVTIVKELRKIMGHDPKKVFIEMARGSEGEKKPRDSRKQKILDIYKTCKLENEELIDSLESTDSTKLRGDKLYLYYMQLGRCMYSGERIDLSDLGSYDIDHIYPQSKVMDDSLDNRVLVKRVLNAQKTDQYPLPGEWQSKMKGYWEQLRRMGLISEEKYKRLVRKDEFSEGELVGFVSRQIVETRQSSKAVAHLFEEMFEDTEIVYVKAGNVSRFRHGVDDYARGRTKQEIQERMKENQFIKVREVNDYHHAKDAYLNIVVGNVFNSKFTANPYSFFRQKDHVYSMNAMYKFPIERGGVIAWEPTTEEKEGTMSTVRRMMRKNNIQFTRYAKEVHGGFFDQQILKKGKGQVPLKGSGAISSIEKYGGYNKAAGAYFFLVEHTQKTKRVRSIEFVPIYLSKHIGNSVERLLDYCVEELHLVEPRVLIKKIKFDTLFEMDGFRMHLTGRTGNQLIFKNANQLILDTEEDLYVKKLGKFLERRKANRELRIQVKDGINENLNINLLELLIRKMSSSPYKERCKNVVSGIDIGKFKKLSIEEQSETIMNIVPLLQCNVLVANLKIFGGGEKSGIVKISKNINPQSNICIINQSSTGLFEKQVLLNAL